MAFTVTRVDHDDGGPVRLRLAGELDMSGAPQLDAAIDGLATAGERRLLVDLTDLTFCDSTGIAALVRGDSLAAGEGGWLRVTGATGRVERVLKLTGLAEVLGYGFDLVDPAGTDRPDMG
ncbi:STAS domain-containing protein [Micromonospora sp. Llam7]|uniref:STAS domain-containing protein n=1 Tax=Micromonospora tarapacensis TaxID=2835305 RepID=UPI001C82E5E4|nr:STAS domain-containing protein [Micromonospora tarapacensis]